MIYLDDEQATKRIVWYADEPMDILILFILSACVVGVGAFWYLVWQIFT